MESWGIAANDSDAFADVCDQFYDKYGNGESADTASVVGRTELPDTESEAR